MSDNGRKKAKEVSTMRAIRYCGSTLLLYLEM